MRMKTMKLVMAFATSSAFALVGASVASANADTGSETGSSPSMGSGSGSGSTERGQMIHSTATVSSIDKKTRTVVLKKEDGDMVSVQVPTEMTGFDRLNTGDKVDVDYYESVAVSMLPPGSKPSATQRVSHGHGGGHGGAVRETTVSAEVVAVDPTANTVTFRGPKGGTRKVEVQDPEMQAKLKTLKVGQTVQFTYTEAIAATIRPKKME